MIFQIQAGEPRIIPRKAFFAHKGFEQPLFRYPIELPDQLSTVPSRDDEKGVVG